MANNTTTGLRIDTTTGRVIATTTEQTVDIRTFSRTNLLRALLAVRVAGQASVSVDRLARFFGHTGTLLVVAALQELHYDGLATIPNHASLYGPECWQLTGRGATVASLCL